METSLSSEIWLVKLLETLPDPREEWKVRHKLPTMLFCTFCAVLCGAEGWPDVVLFCKIRQEWVSRYVDFPNGIPSAWTLRRVFSRLQPEVIETLLCTHAAMLVKQTAGDEAVPTQICIDGKALRGSKRFDLKCLQVLTAFAHEQGLVLAQKDGETKSSQVTPYLKTCLLPTNDNLVEEGNEHRNLVEPTTVGRTNVWTGAGAGHASHQTSSQGGLRDGKRCLGFSAQTTAHLERGESVISLAR